MKMCVPLFEFARPNCVQSNRFFVHTFLPQRCYIQFVSVIRELWRILEVSEDSRTEKVLLMLELRDFFADGRLATCHSLGQRLLQSGYDPLDALDLKIHVRQKLLVWKSLNGTTLCDKNGESRQLGGYMLLPNSFQKHKKWSCRSRNEDDGEGGDGSPSCVATSACCSFGRSS